MDINEFNAKIVEEGKRILGKEYGFSSSSIESVMFGHIDKTTVTYRATVFNVNNIAISVQSVNIDLLFEMLHMKYKEMVASQSSINL